MQHFLTILNQGLKGEFSQRERLLSPFLFAATFLLLFSFAAGELDPDTARKVFVAEAFLGVFFALEIVFSRTFEAELDDQVFDLLRLYPIPATTWFWGKYALVSLVGSVLSIPTLVLASMFSGVDISPLDPVIVLTVVLAIFGLSAIGILISALVTTATAKQILYPLLYFPLTTPILLASVNATLFYIETGQVNDLVYKWLGMLVAFDAIFAAIGCILFAELVETDG